MPSEALPKHGARADLRRIESHVIVEGPFIEDLPQPGLRLIRLTIDHLAPLQWPQGARIVISCPERDLQDVEVTLLRSGVDLRRKRARLELIWDMRTS